MKKAVFLDRDGVINKPLIKNRKPFPPQNVGNLELTDDVEYLLTILKKKCS